MRDGELYSVPLAAGVKIYAGGIVVAGADGYARPGRADGGDAYLGRAEARVDNTGGADGAVSVMVRRGRAHLWNNHGSDAVTQASVGRLCYVADDETVAASSDAGARSPAGVVLCVEGSNHADGAGVWVAGEYLSESRVIRHEATIDFEEIAAGGLGESGEIAVAGAALGDAVAVGLPAAVQAGLVFDGRVTEKGKIRVRAQNVTASAVDAAGAKYVLTIVRG